MASVPRRVYGRAVEMTRLASELSGVSVVVGDPGTGKTEVLRSTSVEGALIGTPLQLARRSGALQTALLESLGKALMDHAASHSAEAFARRLGSVVRELGENQASTAGKAVSRFLWGVAQDRLGQNATAVLKEFSSAVGATQGQQLADRVMQTAAEDVMTSFFDFAAAAIDLVESPIVLRLDAAERLHPDDFAQLLDMTEGCPDGLAVWIGHANSDHDSARRISELEIAGATVIPIGGLEHPALMEWLNDEGIEGARADQIEIATLGYPLFVVAAIEHLQRGRVLGDLRGEAGFVAQVRQNFNELPIELQQTCLALAAHTVPLDQHQIPDAIDLEPEIWSLHESQLASRRLLSATVDDRPWFHELARRALWDETFTAFQRALSADKAIPFLLGQVGKSGRYSLEHARSFVALFEASETELAAHPEVETCLGLSREPLGLLAALLELQEPPANAVDGDMLFEYARTALDLDGDLVASLRHLESVELVVLSENDHAAAVVGFWKSTSLRLVLLGRAMAEFDRTLLPSTASTIFESVFRPTLDAFLGAHHGIGRPTLTGLAETAGEFDRSETDGVISIHRRFGVLVRSRWGHVPLYSAIGFEQATERDVALESLAGLDGLEVFGERLEVQTLMAWPHPEPVREGLLEAAMSSLPSGAALHDCDERAMQVAENLRRRLQILVGIRSALTPVEREILEIDALPGYVWAMGERGVVVARVLGLGEVREVPALLQVDLWKFWQSTVARVCNLAPNQRATVLETHTRAPGAADALKDIVDDLTKTLRAFNRASRRPTKMLGTEPQDFESAIVAGLQRRQTMVEAMSAALGIPSDHVISTGSREFVIYLEPEDPAFFRGANGMLMRRVDRSGPFSVSVRMVGAVDEAFNEYREWSREINALGVEVGQSNLLHGLDDLLGFGRGGRFVELR
ncbi:MAG: ATP-binding protein [Aeromicrobium sp.]|uniref:ATP-binding protein n=1 Tax=Aeromicrobium sp. TaxID=1871063 RepID=UPI0026028000|nr:ATP-binding protein [Aeromicrobium sp.]MDF1705969.1 ATP-binding protein [Aeromicrobium sp.]